MVELLILALAGLATWLLYEFKVKDRESDITTQLPEELRRHKVFSKEKTFRCTSPVRLVGKPDLILQDASGALIACETKTRRKLKVYESDVLQLSAYKVLLQASTGKRVHDVGWIRLITEDGNEFRKVRLIDEEEVAAAAQLHMRLSSGNYTGVKCEKKFICNTCAFKTKCDRMDV